MGESYISAPTDDAYAIACKKRGVPPHSEVLEDGTKAHWVGSSKAEKLILNFHGMLLKSSILLTDFIKLDREKRNTNMQTGGGYVVPAAPEFFEFMFRIVNFCKSKGKDVSCLMLAYGILSPAPHTDLN
jgi:hypothetical protein